MATMQQQQQDVYCGMTELERRFVDTLTEVFNRPEFGEVAGSFQIANKLMQKWNSLRTGESLTLRVGHGTPEVGIRMEKVPLNGGDRELCTIICPFPFPPRCCG